MGEVGNRALDASRCPQTPPGVSTIPEGSEQPRERRARVFVPFRRKPAGTAPASIRCMRRMISIFLIASLTATAYASETPVAPAIDIADDELFEKSLDAARQALEYYGEWQNPAAAERVADLGYRLAQYGAYPDYPFTFFVVDIPVPNAFALPGGQIFVTRGMLEQGIDDEQLAGLLGHEIAHVTRTHGVRLQKRATLLNVLSQALLVGAILTSDSGRQPSDIPPDRYGRVTDNSADRIYGAAATGMLLGELLLRSYSREFEDEADEEGQRLAAAAGFSPSGTVALMDTLGTRMPQDKEFGYWRTHPFFTDRVLAARARSLEMRASTTPRVADAYRQATQKRLLEALENPPEPKRGATGEEPKPEERPRADRPGRGGERELMTRRIYLEKAALAAWPAGPDAEKLRLAALERVRRRELERPELSRNYGSLVVAWQEQLEVVKRLTPQSPFVADLERGITELEGTRNLLYPRAAEVFAADVWETSFLESFLSNWPKAPESSKVALALGDARARLRREGPAAESYLEAWRLDPDGEAGQRALTGLRRMTPRLDDLIALEKLAAETGDTAIATAAAARLEKLAGSYTSLVSGADYLEAYPNGAHADVISARLSSLADALYGEVVLYQAVGDVTKAAERIAEILEHAPFSPAADRLRDRTLADS